MSGDFDFGLDGFKSSVERLGEEREQRLRHQERIQPFNVGYLDDCCLGIYPTDLVVVCAASGAGKTSIAALMAQFASAQGRRVHFFALEAHKSEIEQRMLFRSICDVLRERGKSTWGVTFQRWMYGWCSQAVTEEVELAARARLGDDLAQQRTFYRGEKFTAEDITRLFLAVQHETDLIVLDHLHYVDSDDANENRGMRAATKAIRDAALSMEKPVIVVAHMRKKDRAGKQRIIPDIDDVHGSSDIVKIATKVVMLAPARDRAAKQPGIANTYLQVVKDRFAGVAGYAALCAYDLRTLRYHDEYVVGRLSFMGDKLQELPPSQKPEWAVRGIATGKEPTSREDTQP